MSDTNTPVKLDLWAVPDSHSRYGDGYAVAVMCEGESPGDAWFVLRDTHGGPFRTPYDAAHALQELLNNLGEGTVGR